MRLLLETGGGNSPATPPKSFPYGFAAIIIIGFLAFPQTSNFIENSLPVKTIRSIVLRQPKNINIDGFNHSFGGKKVFPLKGYTAQSAKYSSLPGECRPVGSCTRRHAGVDYPAPAGTPVLAVLDGVVIESKVSNTVSGILAIQSGSIRHRYVHLNPNSILNVGDKVEAGQEIAKVGEKDAGSTGEHLHFEVYVNDKLHSRPDRWLAQNNNIASSSKRVKAFLDTIAWAETGTAEEEGYKSLVFGGKFNSFNSHPNIKQCAPINGRKVCSTAAGKYQFLISTWNRLGMKDFSPGSQDAGAIALIKEKGAYEDVIAGNFEKAACKVGKVWASLPCNSYGQNPKSMPRLKNFYNSRL